MTGAMVECLKLGSCKSVAAHDMCQLTVLAVGNAMSGCGVGRAWSPNYPIILEPLCMSVSC